MIKLILFLLYIRTNIRSEINHILHNYENFYNMIKKVNRPDIKLKKFANQYEEFILIFEDKFNRPIQEILIEKIYFLNMFIQVYFECEIPIKIEREHIEYLIDNYLTINQLAIIRINFINTTKFEKYSIKEKTIFLNFFEKLLEKNKYSNFILFSTKQIEQYEKIINL